MAFVRTGARRVWTGRSFSVQVERFRHDDGGVARREIVRRPDVVAVVAHDEDRLYLVRRPREVVDEPSLLELVRAQLDGTTAALEVARRALGEQAGKGARQWRHLRTLYTVAGYCDEQLHLFEATGLFDRPLDGGGRASPQACTVAWPRLDEALSECRDAATRIAVLLVARSRDGCVDG